MRKLCLLLEVYYVKIILYEIYLGQSNKNADDTVYTFQLSMGESAGA